ncbi:ribosome maturation factor RimP [Actinoalloteichus hymeniacidonis]|uniref:ribosome maturation factor RimP n=1 Tax=Actinoalloteichus hymeniacidonis TaxID=340345 RepID=UPI000853B142|nr:ribosome maturation factor RimP [Actinoalloteichus hymeniacidonis]
MPAGRGAATSAELEPLIAQALVALGFELDSLDIGRAGNRRVVKVVVDSETGIGLDDIASASRAVSSVLDGQDDETDSLFGGPYTLEVTSPGVDRPLTKPRHWRRARRRLVTVRLADGGDLTGRVGACDEDGVTLLVDRTLRRLAFAEVERATVEVEFRPPAEEDLLLLGDEAEHDRQAAGVDQDAHAEGVRSNTEEKSQ